MKKAQEGITLSGSLLNSRAWASQVVADSLVICRAKGKPSFFITITTNPNWPEIKAQLGSGQSASDISTIVCRVFKARLENAIATMRLKFGSVVYMVRVIEFQKWGLPHAHRVLKGGIGLLKILLPEIIISIKRWWEWLNRYSQKYLLIRSIPSYLPKFHWQ